MTPNQLRNFLLMLDERTFVAAARKAGVTSQGFTKSIRSLEKELDVPLFEADDSGRQTPTPFAQALRPFCQQTLESYRAVVDELAQLKTGRRKQLVIAVATGTLSLLGIDFFDRFKQARPNISLVCINSSDMDAEAAVARGEAGLAITVMPTEACLETRKLGSSKLYAWVPASNPLANKKSLAMTDIDGQNVAVVGPNYKGYIGLLEMCEANDISPRSITPLSENTMLHQFAREGRGIAFTSEHLLALFADDEAIRPLPVQGGQIDVVLAWSRDRELTPQAVAFIDYCRQQVKDAGKKPKR